MMTTAALACPVGLNKTPGMTMSGAPACGDMTLTATPPRGGESNGVGPHGLVYALSGRDIQVPVCACASETANTPATSATPSHSAPAARCLEVRLSLIIDHPPEVPPCEGLRRVSHAVQESRHPSTGKSLRHKRHCSGAPSGDAWPCWPLQRTCAHARRRLLQASGKACHCSGTRQPTFAEC